MKFDRKKMREKLAERHKESYNKRDDSGRYKSIFANLPANASFWKVSEDEHIIDIIPYVASAKNPDVTPGEPAHCVDIWVHRGVGPSEDSYVCPSRTFKKPCPVCEFQRQMKEQEEFDEDAVKKLSPSRRVIYNVWVHDSTKDEEKGIQLWDASHYLFGKEIAELAKLPKGGGFVEYTDPDAGKQISFTRKGKGALSTKYTAFRFLEREEAIPDTILYSTFVIEDFIHFADYKEIEAALYGKELAESDEDETLPEPEKEEAPKEERKRRGRPAAVEEDIVDNPCPYGHTFGVSIEKFDDCQKCEKWDPCSEKADEAEAELEALALQAEKEKLEKEKAAKKKENETREEPIRRRRRTE